MRSNYSKKRELLDPTFKLEEKYFYQKLSDDEWSAISTNLKKYFSDTTVQPKSILTNKKLKKGGSNVSKLREL
jgi:hypothetical protein